jgi:hypothetical protein
MANLGKSKKIIRKPKNRSRKTLGGVKSVANASVRTAEKKLDEYKNRPNTPLSIHQLGNSLPLVIIAAKKAIIVANENPGDENARKLAIIKSDTADYIASETGKRKNWRKEKNLNPNHSARDWYETGSEVTWKIKDVNESAKKRMDTVLPHLIEKVKELELEPDDDEIKVRGKRYREAKRRFERRTEGLDSASPLSSR